MASKTLSGLVRCGLLAVDTVLPQLLQWAAVPTNKRKVRACACV